MKKKTRYSVDNVYVYVCMRGPSQVACRGCCRRRASPSPMGSAIHTELTLPNMRFLFLFTNSTSCGDAQHTGTCVEWNRFSDSEEHRQIAPRAPCE